MTTYELSKLTPEQKRVKIAEAWGFEPGTINETSWLGYCDPRHAETLYQLGYDVEDSDEKPNHILAKVPCFPGDLNAMHEAEKTLKDRFAYWRNLIRVMESDLASDIIFATAAQRADAFLLTI